MSLIRQQAPAADLTKSGENQIQNRSYDTKKSFFEHTPKEGKIFESKLNNRN